jgi:hypothetical protein
MDLKKMRENNFAKEMEKLVLARKLDKRGLFVEETALYQYSAAHKDLGYFPLYGGFNTFLEIIPKRFQGLNEQVKEITSSPKMKKNLFFQDTWLFDLLIIHYYRWAQPKPWNCVHRYEADKCPSYTDLWHPFWKKVWISNPWAFCEWYKYYRKLNKIKFLRLNQ